MKASLQMKLCTAAILGLACATPAFAQVQWTTIVNNSVTVPGTTAKFNSYNQPAINSSGLVVFRARGRTPTGSTAAAASSSSTDTVVEGIFMRDMASPGALTTIATRSGLVPAPNNLGGTFNEFPSSPRIDATSSFMVTRGQSTPVYRYVLADGVTETRVGTSGIYAGTGGALTTGASLLGAVKERQPDTTYGLTFPYFSVPDAPAGTRFDQFPGSPTASDGSKIAFKGNFTDPNTGLGLTGVYFRDVSALAGKAPTTLVASANTLIPGTAVKFGATAAPSAANGYVAFTGWDNEDAPTIGGVYRAPLVPSPVLQTLVAIGQQVPGEAPGTTFRNFGEGLSMSEDGRYVAFFATWGAETSTKVLYCPADGNTDRIAYCQARYPSGYTVAVPVHQGIFVADAQTGTIVPIAKTWQEGIVDMVYWVYSGAPPGTGGGSEGTIDESREPPRWRSSAFAALAAKPGRLYGSSLASSPFQVAFKATRNGVDGIYVRRGDIAAVLEPIVETYITSGQSVDPAAPANSIVTAVGVERDGFRDENLAVAVSMLYETVDTSLGWAGLYLAKAAAIDRSSSADVSITQSTASDSATFGSDVVFTLTITNAGPSPATAVTVRDYLPPGSTFVSASAGCSVSARVVSCDVGSLAAGASRNLIVTVKPGVGSAMTNMADVRAREADLAIANNSSSRTLQVAAGLAASLSGISTRALVLGGDDVEIVGFIVSGTTSKTVVISGGGPSLAASGVTNPLKDPKLTLVRASDRTIIATNDDWSTAANAAQLAATGFAPAHPSEPAILANLAPGAYTAILAGKNAADTGVGLATVYEVDHPENQLVGISTRARILGGEGAVISGFVVQGTGRQLVVVQGLGPSLAQSGVVAPAGNPSITLVRMSDRQIIATNDDWQVNNPSAAAIQARGLAPPDPSEAAVMVSLDPGVYTAVVTGSQGTGLAAVYSLPETAP